MPEGTLCDSGGWAIEEDTDRPPALAVLEHARWSLRQDVGSQAGLASRAAKTPQTGGTEIKEPLHAPRLCASSQHPPPRPGVGVQICE